MYYFKIHFLNMIDFPTIQSFWLLALAAIALAIWISAPKRKDIGGVLAGISDLHRKRTWPLIQPARRRVQTGHPYCSRMEAFLASQSNNLKSKFLIKSTKFFKIGLDKSSLLYTSHVFLTRGFPFLK